LKGALTEYEKVNSKPMTVDVQILKPMEENEAKNNIVFNDLPNIDLNQELLTVKTSIMRAPISEEDYDKLKA
jgi:hypothetical protein